MKRVPAILVLASIVLGAGNGSEDRDRLEKLRQMTPGQRAALRARLEQIKKLPEIERQRLKENLERVKSMPVDEVKRLGEKVRKLPADERKELGELAAGFFKWGHRRELLQGFPRGLFFSWLKNNRSQEVLEIRALDSSIPGPRVDRFVKLYFEFKEFSLGRLEEHAQRHRCAAVEDVRSLRDSAARDLWPRFGEALRACPVRK